MLRGLYDWVMGLAAHHNATWVLAAVAFIESSVFPVPPDALLVPMVLAERAKAWWYAFLCTVTSVLGGLAGYAIGFFFLWANCWISGWIAMRLCRRKRTGPVALPRQQ